MIGIVVGNAVEKALLHFDSGNRALAAHGFVRELELSEHTAHLYDDWHLTGEWLRVFADRHADDRDAFCKELYRITGLKPQLQAA